MSQEGNNGNSLPLQNYILCSCGKKDKDVSECKDCKPQKTNGMKGWVCPVCGRGVSPFTSFCPCVQPPLGLTIRY